VNDNATMMKFDNATMFTSLTHLSVTHISSI